MKIFTVSPCPSHTTSWRLISSAGGALPLREIVWCSSKCTCTGCIQPPELLTMFQISPVPWRGLAVMTFSSNCLPFTDQPPFERSNTNVRSVTASRLLNAGRSKNRVGTRLGSPLVSMVASTMNLSVFMPSATGRILPEGPRPSSCSWQFTR